MAIVVRHGKNSKHLGLREIVKNSLETGENPAEIVRELPKNPAEIVRELPKTDKKSEEK